MSASPSSPLPDLGTEVRETEGTHEFWSHLYEVCTPREAEVTAADVTLRVSVWDAERRPGASPTGPDVLLVHGGAEQRSWWDHLVPLLRGGRRVVGFDLSGHGDSGARPAYSLEAWAHEAATVAQQICGTRPVLVGHSMGGLVSTLASQLFPDRYRGVVALDSPTRRTTGGHAIRREKIASRPPRAYAALDEAMDRFRTYPPVTTAPAAVMTYIARAAYARSVDGWHRKFDPRVYDRPQAPDDFVRRAPVPTQWVRAEHGFIDDAMRDRILAGLGPAGEMVDVAAAGHHLTLEQPIATAWLVSSFLQRLDDVDSTARS